ncbi:MAG: hypothetical protein HND53_12285 [Proteobacteria bacterium]|nr:hypothetical protein [Pseudomonadota bacterium]NOG61272.1 hypothetical protein [Pseudomonadota bacterium]
MNKVIAYLVVWFFGLIFIIALLTLIFESDTMVRLTGLVVAIASIIFGNLVANKYWPNKNKNIEDNSV